MIGNFYEVLELEVDASIDEVKKAYKTLLRKHPPEKDPDEFKKIRNAYEVLSNQKSKAEYDSRLKYKDEIDNYMSIGLDSLDNDNFLDAITAFKKILVIEPSLGYVRNLLGLSYLYDQQVEQAIYQFERLVKEDPDNSTYNYNLGISYKKNNILDLAKEYVLKAYELDKINPDIIIMLSKIYSEQNRVPEAIEILKSGINADQSVDFEDFIYFFQMVEIYLISGNMEKVEETIGEIKKIIPQEKEAKEYVAWRVAKLGYELFELKIYYLSKKLAEWASEIDPDNEDIIKLFNISDDLDKAFTLFKKIENDSRVIDPLKLPIFYFLYGDELQKDQNYTEKQIEEILENNIIAIQSYIDGDPNKLQKSINILKNEYKILYEYKKEFFDDVNQHATESIKLTTQWKSLNDDSRITNGIKRLIALWLSKDVSDRDREEYFNDIIKQLEYESPNDVVYSINRVQTVYKKLYELNPKFLNEIRTKLKRYVTNDYSNKPTSRKNVSSNNTNPSNKGSNTSSNKSSNKSYSTYSSNNTYSSNQNYNSSCFVATAAYGTPWADEIVLLRRWRDKKLQKSYSGKIFINFYYKFGPYLAKIIERNKIFKSITRFIIKQILNILKRKDIV